MAATNEQLQFRNVPAIDFPFVELSVERLDLLSAEARFIIYKMERARKSVVILNNFHVRLYGKQAVRCTPQSVKVTAAARYASSGSDLKLSSIPVNSFVDLITYLPLPEIKTVEKDYEALCKACEMSTNREIDPRWATYYTCLGTINKEWAQAFFEEVQILLSVNGTIAKIPPQRVETARVREAESTGGLLTPTTRLTEFAIPDEPPQYEQYPIEQQRTASSILARKDNIQDENTSSMDLPQRGQSLNSDNLENVQLQQEENIYIRVLRAKEKAWGLNHPTTLETIELLGKFYADHNRVVEAEEMYVRLLQANKGPR